MFVLLSLFPALRAQIPAKPAAVFSQIPLSQIAFVEAFTSIEPTVAHILGHNVLSYELYVVNMTGQPEELTRIQASSASGQRVLLDATGAALESNLKHTAKEATPPVGKGVISPGEQIVFYARIELPEGVPVPQEIVHRLSFRRQGSTDEINISAADIRVKPAVTVIRSPLRGSNWLAANGPSNTSGHRMGVIPLDGKARVPQRFAIDWVEIDKSGSTYSGDSKKNESYYCYGKKAHAIADGVVTEVKDGIPQNVPGISSRAVPITLETVAGNHIMLKIADGVYALYAHLQPGSLRVKVGDRVKAGQVIGLVGNSGNSTEPHLHFHLIDQNSPLGGEGIPFSYPSYSLLGKGALGDTVKLDWMPSPEHVTGQIPAENQVVQFADETE
jgi:hypothetical protein